MMKSGLCMVAITITIAIAHVCMVRCSPPDPIRCTSEQRYNCTITNTYGAFPDRSTCHAAMVVYPTSESELLSAVANATMNKKKMKVATRHSQSIPKLVCPDGEDGVLISTKHLNRIVNVDESAMTMTVESGVRLGELVSEAAKANMALPYAPYWKGMTVGGMLGTGAHGSSLWRLGSQVHDYVVQLRIVTPAQPNQGYAKVRLLQTGDPDLNAAKVSLGVLGVISQVTLKLQPLFKRSITYETKDDSNFGEEAVSFGKQHEFADFIWYPSQKKVVYRIDNRVSTNTLGDGLLDFPGFRPIKKDYVEILRFKEELEDINGNEDFKCLDGDVTRLVMEQAHYGLNKDDNHSFEYYPVVGYQNRLQASGGCLDIPDFNDNEVCPWDPRVKGLFFHQTTFSVALSEVKSFIEDVHKLVALAPKSLCGLDMYNGILMRYVTRSNAYLGKQEDALDFDFTYYRSHDPLIPRLYEDFMEEIEQMAVFKYNARPHWGKNRNVAFLGAIRKFEKADEFLKVKQSFDPDSLFSSEWTDQILGLKDGLSVVKEGCALEGLCICSEDVHCAPNKGYYCRQGKVYDKARVCMKVGIALKEETEVSPTHQTV